MIKRMIEALILWNLIGTRDQLRGEDDASGWFILPLLVIGPLLWPIGLMLTARKYYKLSWRRSIISSAVVTVWILWLVPVVYFAIAGVLFVATVWYFGNDER
jgi:hypothetical protein